MRDTLPLRFLTRSMIRGESESGAESLRRQCSVLVGAFGSLGARVVREGRQTLRRFILAFTLVAISLFTASSPAFASIHPIVASFCSAVATTNPNVLDPPGQTPTSPNPNDWTVNTLRALQATGFLTLIRDANGNVIGFTIDESVPAVKDGSFPAFSRCPNF